MTKKELKELVTMTDKIVKHTHCLDKHQYDKQHGYAAEAERIANMPTQYIRQVCNVIHKRNIIGYSFLF